MFNPLEIAELTRNIVCKNNKRKYYRFRSSRFYGGIATTGTSVDTVSTYCFAIRVCALKGRNP